MANTIKPEIMWICVLIKNGKIDCRLIETLSETRKEAYRKLTAEGYSRKQLQRYGWKAVKVLMYYQNLN